MMTLLVLLVYFTNPKVKQIRSDRANFQVASSDLLYFKNLRQFYYQSRELKDGQFTAFRLKADSLPSVPLQFSIVHNWRMDEAYIMLQDKEDTTLAGGWLILNEGRDTFSLEQINALEHHELAMHLFEVLQEDEDIVHLTEYGQKPKLIWDVERERENVFAVLRDYFKLTGAL